MSLLCHLLTFKSPVLQAKKTASSTFMLNSRHACLLQQPAAVKQIVLTDLQFVSLAM